METLRRNPRFACRKCECRGAETPKGNGDIKYSGLNLIFMLLCRGAETPKGNGDKEMALSGPTSWVACRGAETPKGNGAPRLRPLDHETGDGGDAAYGPVVPLSYFVREPMNAERQWRLLQILPDLRERLPEPGGQNAERQWRPTGLEIANGRLSMKPGGGKRQGSGAILKPPRSHLVANR